MHYRSPLRNIFLSIGSFFVAVLWNSFIIPLHAQTPTPGAGNLSAQAALPQSSITLTPAQVTANRDTIITIDIVGFTMQPTDTAHVFIGGVEVPTNTITNKRVSIRVVASRIPIAGTYTVTLKIYNGQIFTLATAALTGVQGASGAGDKRRIYWLHGLNSEEEDWFDINSVEWQVTVEPIKPMDMAASDYQTKLDKYNKDKEKFDAWNSRYGKSDVGYKNYIDKILFPDRSQGIAIRYPTKIRKMNENLTELQARYGLTDQTKTTALTIPQTAQRLVSQEMNIPTSQQLPIAIGHSMGGLVLRSIARQIESTRATHRFGGIITMGTPNNGAALVSGISTTGGLSKNGISVAGEQVALAAKELGAGPGASLLVDPLTGVAATVGTMWFSLTGSTSPIPTIPLTTPLRVGLFFGAGLVPPLGGLALTANSFILHNLFNYQQTLSDRIYDDYAIARANVQDMYVEPNGNSGGKNFSPFLQDLNTPLSSPRPGNDALNPIPVINIWGNVPESELYSIASANFARRAQDDSYDLLGRTVKVKPQYEKIPGPGVTTSNTDDKFIPNLVNEVAKPIYIGYTAYHTALAGLFVGLSFINPPLLAVAAVQTFAAGQWIRGWSFLDAGAHIAYRKVIGAYKKQKIAINLPFGLSIPLGEIEVRDDSDAFIPAWSQRSNGAKYQFKADNVNHGLMANHPNMTTLFNRIFNLPDKDFFLP